MRLGELLIGEGLLGPEELEAALARQILHGGRLGSNLVELGFISMEKLALALGRQHGKAAALESHFSQIDGELTSRLTAEMAASWHAVPLGRTGPDGRCIAIATTDPFVDDLVCELQNIFDAEIVQAISPELRLLYWLEQVYKIERLNRFKRVDRPTGHAEPGSERRVYLKTLSDVEELANASQLAKVAVKRIAVPLSGEIELPAEPTDHQGSLRSIRQATGRAKMAQLVTYLLEEGFDQTFSAGMLLTVRDELAIGWDGFVRDQPDKTVDVLAVPLTHASMLSGPCETKEALFGMPQERSIIDERFWQFLGDTPAEVAILPVEVLGQVACVLYTQSASGIRPELCSDLGDLSRSISACLTRLIRSASR